MQVLRRHIIPDSLPLPDLGVRYHVYSNTGLGGPIDYSSPVATVSGTSWTTPSLAFPGDWRFGVRAFDSFGEEQNLDATVEIILEAGGNDITSRPLPPVGMRAFATGGGGIRVEWAYPIVDASRIPTGFHVYVGTGGVPSYGSSVAMIPFAAAIAGSFVANLSGLTDGTTYAVGVRAYNAAAEEQNTVAASVTAKASGPAPVMSLTASTI